tara:strand:+ start:931 stop:1917 length:987 start_codon:yes stop_codon:yes gene_type:complete
MQNMARFGRNGDTRMAHVSPGEMVVPPQVLRNNPKIARGLGRAFRDVGADPKRYVVGSKRNSINPITGEPEFFLDKILPFLTSAAQNPLVQGAIGNVALQAIRGKKPSLRDALIGGAVGGGLGAITGSGTGLDALDNLLGVAQTTSKAAKPIIDASKGVAALETPKTVSRAEGLLGIGELLNTNPSKGIGRILNTKAGEMLAFGIGSQLLDALFSEEEDPDPTGSIARFNRPFGQSPVRFRDRRREPTRTARELQAMYAKDGGVANFPRRNGGIMPSEGSGTKDDVPAMLTAGEFVMTRDAVKGAGDGSLKKGIQRMYGMMDNLERKA